MIRSNFFTDPEADGSAGKVAPRLLWVLFGIALLSRAVGSCFLPNAEQDGYSYAEMITRLTNEIATGRIKLSDLYGFWLPSFQLVSAAINVLIHEPIVSGKIVNAICGAVSLVLVFTVTLRITANVILSLVAFGLMLLDPLHILYSAACMTDVPHACAVLASLLLAMRRRWVGAAAIAAVAESIRVESWALILAIPLLQWLAERRISLLTVLLTLLPPLGWIGIAWLAKGDPLAYFADRARYHVEYIQFHPGRTGFYWPVVRQDVDFLLLGAVIPVFAGALAAATAVIVNLIRRRPSNVSLLAPATYSAAILGLLILAYVTKSQPVWLPRYGLIFFALGLPLFAWTIQWTVSLTKRRLLKRILVIGILSACVFEMSKQLPILGKVRQDFQAHQRIAGALVAGLHQAPPGALCFSDDVAIRVLSKLPEETFVRSSTVPGTASQKADDFLSWLRAEKASLLVYFPTEDSVPVKLFPELSNNGQSATVPFERVAFAHSTFGPDIWLYRLR